jgi:hypothetical protein
MTRIPVSCVGFRNWRFTMSRSGPREIDYPEGGGGLTLDGEHAATTLIQSNCPPAGFGLLVYSPAP